jgi:large subunit ribosomal protein L9
MHVILLQDYSTLGEAGATVQVTDGHARNFLFPRRIAVPANAATRRMISARTARSQAVTAHTKAQYHELVKKLNAKVFVVRMRCSDQGTLYGSVTRAMIADAMVGGGFSVDPSWIRADGLKSLGTHEISVSCPGDIVAKCRVRIDRIGQKS